MRRSRGGFSLIEVVIASLVLIVLVLVVFAILMNSTEHYENQSVLLALDAHGREVLNDISKELRMSKTDFLSEGSTGATIRPPTGGATVTSDLMFRLPGSLPAGTLPLQEYKQNPDRLFTRRVRYTWVAENGETAADGIDNNKNGLVDEGVLQKIEDDLRPDGSVVATRRTRICPDLKANGLSFRIPEKPPGQVEITVVLEKIDPKTRKKTISRTVQTTVELRN